MERRIYDEINVDYYGVDETWSWVEPDADYTIVRSRPEDTVRSSMLEQNGFTFHNRTFLCEIPLQKLNQGLAKLVRADVKKDDTFSEDLYELAGRTFMTDRRFHLKKAFDQEFAKKIIRGYIDGWNDAGCFFFKCFYKGLLTGFTLIHPLGHTECENVLGAVEPEYQNRGMAFNLYVYMADALRQMGYKSLYGRISTSNTPSINLHAMLGGKFSAVEDEYIIRKDDL